MVTCPACGAESPDGFRFCGSCGAPVPAVAASQESRKTVTVLFCDVTGSTEIGERLDPESLRRVMASYFDAMRAAVERHGGTVEKFIGDAVMAVFGVPVLHEDDALRALRAAVEMRVQLAELNEELIASYGTRLELRIGVNTGEVVTGTAERLVTGDAVNVAARLEQAAKPGEILAGDETVRLTRDAIEIEELPPLELKGKSEAVTAYRVLSVAAGAPGHARKLDTPMIGRTREQRLLLDAWERVVSQRSCALFTLLGAAGVGKSRLVEDMRSRIHAHVVVGRCLSYGEGITYWPVVEVLKQLPSAADLGLDESAQAALANVLGESDHPTGAEQISWAVRKVFEAAAAQRPLLVYFDDVHWGEHAFLELIRYVADLSRGAPILVLCAGRPELLEREPAWGGGMLNATTVLLEPLSTGEVDLLLASLAGDTFDVALRERIRTAADGNPLFVEEMVSLAREEGGGEVSVPPSIQALLAARIDQLDAAERGVLARGSIEGQVFHLGGVRALAPDEPEPEGRVVALVRKELVRPDKSTLPAEEAYRFRHLLIRDAAYEGLPKATRAELHERFAEWLDERAVDLVERDEIVGYHLEQAYRYRAELGPVDDEGRELGGRGAERLLAGGRAAHGRGDVAAAVVLLKRADALLDEEDPSRPSVLADLAITLLESGEMTTANETIELAVHDAERHGDRQVIARAQARRFIIEALTKPDAETTAHLAQIESMIAELGDDADAATLAEAWGTRGRLEFFIGQARLAEESYARTVEYARQSRHFLLESESLQWWAGAKLFGPAPVDEGLAFIAGLADLAARDRSVDAYRLGFAAVLLAMRGRFDEARATIVEGSRWTRELGLEHRRLGGMMGTGYVEVLAGDLEAAEAQYREGWDGLGALGEIGFRSTIGTQLADVLSKLGRDDEAASLIDECESISQLDDFDPQARIRLVRARLLARSGELVEAERLAREALALMEPTDYIDQHGQALVSAAEVIASGGRQDEAAQMLEQAIALFERKGNVVLAERTRGRLGSLRPS